MASIVSILVLIAITSFFSSSSAEISRKELRSKEANKETVVHFGDSAHPNRIDPSRVVQLSWRPRVFLYQGFLSDEECDHLVSLARIGDEQSLTDYDHLGNGNIIRRLRSLETHLSMEDAVVSRIEERISAWTFLPKENSRPLQVFRYELEELGKNFNYFGNKSSMEQGVPLVATVVLYLSNVTRGGEILFPESELKSKVWSDCGTRSNILRPVKGNAILFFTLRPNAAPAKSSPHTRCPVLEGEMWCAIQFLHARAIAEDKVPSDSECTDEDDNCPKWAAIGECQRNPVFMVGSPDYYGTCRKSCNVC